MAEANTGKSKFLEAFKKSDKLKKAIKNLKNARNPNERPDIPDGKYVAVLRGGVFTEFKGIPRVVLNLQVDRGPQKGTPLQRRYDFGVVSDKATITEEEVFERIGQDLIKMGQTLKNETPEALLQAFEALFEEKPLLRITVQVRGTFLNIYIDGLVEEEASSKPAEDEEEDDEESDEEASDETEDEEASEEGEDSEDEADEADEEAEQPVQAKDRVLFKPKGAKKPEVFSVMASNAAKRLCDLRHAKTNAVHKNVSWDDVQHAEVE